jgi:hypothetical protein
MLKNNEAVIVRNVGESVTRFPPTVQISVRQQLQDFQKLCAPNSPVESTCATVQGRILDCAVFK